MLKNYNIWQLNNVYIDNFKILTIINFQFAKDAIIRRIKFFTDDENLGNKNNKNLDNLKD